jgi:hypothetical protein
MREIDGMTYADLANALDVTVPAVKSLLVRARVGLVEAAEARDADCAEIQADLLRAYDKGVKASGRARKHMRTCSSCTEYRGALRGMRRSFAALAPVGVGPLAFAAKLIGLGGSGAAGAAAGGGGAGAGAAVAGGGVATATACKVAAVVCTAAIATGGAVEVNHKIATNDAPAKVESVTKTAKSRPAKPAPAPISAPVRTGPQVTTSVPARTASVSTPATKRKRAAAKDAKPATDTKVTTVPAALQQTDTPAPTTTATPDPQAESGGVRAPDPTVVPTPVASPAPPNPVTQAPQATPAPATSSEQPATSPSGGGVEAPAPVDTAPPPAGG